MKKKLITFCFILTGMALAFYANYLLIEDILIPDSCYYHQRETSFLFDAFYRTDSFDGGHPFPTIFNLIFTLLIGGFLGWLALRIIRKGSIKKA